MINIGVLVSGSGTNLQSIIDACSKGAIDGKVAVVISDNANAFAITRAKDKSIPTRVISSKDFADRQSFDMELVKVLKDFNTDLVTLAGFMRVLTHEFLKHFPGRIMNIHPALLPSFPGLGVRQKAIDYGVKFSGCTVHFVDEGVDTGPIIIQAVVPVYPDDKEEQLQKRILRLEHKIYPKAIQLFVQGRLKIADRKVFVDGIEKEQDQCMVNPLLDT